MMFLTGDNLVRVAHDLDHSFFFIRFYKISPEYSKKHVLAERKIPHRRDHDDKPFKTGMLLNGSGARERQG
jgi:hypothetical protein